MFSKQPKTMEDCDELVTSAYRCAMACAAEQALDSIAFSLISASIFRGPQSLEKVLAAGIAGIRDGVYPGLREVHMVAFTPSECKALNELCTGLLPLPGTGNA